MKKEKRIKKQTKKLRCSRRPRLSMALCARGYRLARATQALEFLFF